MVCDSLCVCSIVEKEIDATTVTYVFVMAEMYEAKRLTESCLKFMKENWDAVSRSDYYKNELTSKDRARIETEVKKLANRK